MSFVLIMVWTENSIWTFEIDNYYKIIHEPVTI